MGGLPTPLVVLYAVPCFCSQHLRSGSWVLVFLYLIVHNLPNCTCTQLFLVPYISFFVFCCWRRCLSRCKPCSKGAQVPACLSFIACLLFSPMLSHFLCVSIHLNENYLKVLFCGGKNFLIVCFQLSQTNDFLDLDLCCGEGLQLCLTQHI